MPDSSSAARRYWLLQLTRFTSIAVVLVGIAIIGEQLAAPEWLGSALLIIGAAAFFALPLLMARRWKSSDP